MQSAQTMATQKVAAVSSGLREVSISSSTGAASGGAQEEKGNAGTGEAEGEDDVDEEDPLWKVSYS